MLGDQCLTWLQFGEWTPHSLDDIWRREGWAWPRADWVGFQRIIDWLLSDFLSWPTTLTAIVCGGGVALWAAVMAHRLENQYPPKLPKF